MPRKKITKIVLPLLTIIAFAISIYYIVTVYAVFYSEATGTVESDLAKWNIFINGTNISSGVTEEFTMSVFNVENNANIETGKIAPGLRGNFIISINPVDTEVSVRYDISIDTSYLEDKKITLVSVEETGTSNTITKTGENTYTGVMLRKNIKNNYKNDIKITFYWKNDEANNEQDTSIGTTFNSKLQVPVVVNVIQYLGEEISEYTD